MSSYDESLLKGTGVSRAQRQEGYDVELLNQHQETPPTAPHVTLPNESNKEAPYSPALNERRDMRAPKRAWYRTKGGLIGLVILGIIIIAAVVGGAVGGTHHKKTTASPPSSGSSNSTAAPQPSGGGLNGGGGSFNTSTSSNSSALGLKQGSLSDAAIPTDSPGAYAVRIRHT